MIHASATAVLLSLRACAMSRSASRASWVAAVSAVPSGRKAMGVPAGKGSACRYLPGNTPPANGEYGDYPMPRSPQMARTLRSAPGVSRLRLF